MTYFASIGYEGDVLGVCVRRGSFRLFDGFGYIPLENVKKRTVSMYTK